MLQVTTPRPLEEMEAAFCMAAQHHGAQILAVTNFAQLLREHGRAATHEAMLFTVCHTDLYAALLAADLRFAAFLPCRVAAVRAPAGLSLETLSPKQICSILNRPDLERLTAPLEVVLREIMEEASRPSAHAHAARHHAAPGPGAVEGQMNMRAAIPQRIDCRGTKIEDLGGTGVLDAPGG